MVITSGVDGLLFVLIMGRTALQGSSSARGRLLGVSGNGAMTCAVSGVLCRSGLPLVMPSEVWWLVVSGHDLWDSCGVTWRDCVGRGIILLADRMAGVCPV